MATGRTLTDATSGRIPVTTIQATTNQPFSEFSGGTQATKSNSGSSNNGSGTLSGSQRVDNWVARGFDAKKVTNSGNLTAGTRDEILNAGVPSSAIKIITDGIVTGKSQRDIEDDLADEYGIIPATTYINIYGNITTR